MTEQLPICIYANDELVLSLVKIESVINRLEAQFNFQTMTANWYGDEDEIISITLWLRNPESFEQEKIFAQQAVEYTGEQKNWHCQSYSDDVFSLYNEQDKQLNCTVAITAAELTLLSEQDKLLAPYLQKKLHKVFQCIAVQLTLPRLMPL